MLPASLTDGHRSDDVAGCQTLSCVCGFLQEVPVRHNGTFRLLQCSGGRAALALCLSGRGDTGSAGGACSGAAAMARAAAVTACAVPAVWAATVMTHAVAEVRAAAVTSCASMQRK